MGVRRYAIIAGVPGEKDDDIGSIDFVEMVVPSSVDQREERFRQFFDIVCAGIPRASVIIVIGNESQH